ncbi:MAG TPA: hypothetical protein VHB21_02575 [Minicystis sp.]|nr:hypothetical protein [Minicystis sp.]
MKRAQALAGALVVVAAGLAGSACSPTVGDGSTGGGGEGPPKTWCSLDCGVVARPDECGGNTIVCGANEICAGANTATAFVCCDPATNPKCAAMPLSQTSENLYCAPFGWNRLPIPEGSTGMICAQNETCAARKGSCRRVCCDPRKDPLCGIATKACCYSNKCDASP